MKGRSSAAANLCKWVLAVLKYFDIYTKVKPLQDAAKEASEIASAKQQELDITLNNLFQVQEKVRLLTEKKDIKVAELQLKKD